MKLLLRHLALMLLSAQCVAQVTSLDLPDIGSSTGTIMSPEFERRLGQAFLNEVRRKTDIVSDPEVEAYIRSIGYRLVAHSDNNSRRFTFFVVDSPMINAFAAPGGIVGINSGTILNAETESELAGVMAHEIAHVTQNHVLRSIEMQQKMSIPMMAAMLGAILIATQNPDAGMAAISAIQGGMMQSQINFTRSNEAEADRIGIGLLAESGLNPRGMPSFFEKLQRNSRYAANAPEFLRTHPLTTNRIADTRSRAEHYPEDRPFRESKQFNFIKAKLTVASFENPNEVVDLYEDKLDSERIRDDINVLRYGAALANMEARNFDAAWRHLNTLLDQEPENTSFMLAKAELHSRQGNWEKAIATYEQMQELYPRYRPVVFSLADALLVSNQPRKAREVLKEYGKFNETGIRFYQMLARAEAEAGNPIESGIANAEYYYLTGETRVAMQQLQYLLRQPQPQPDYYQEERIRARLAFLDQELQIEQNMNLAR